MEDTAQGEGEQDQADGKEENTQNGHLNDRKAELNGTVDSKEDV